MNPSLWQYAHTPRLAEEEDHYFLGHPLFGRDALEASTRGSPTPGPLVDLGCGAGRHAIQFAVEGSRWSPLSCRSRCSVEVDGRAELTGLAVDYGPANLCRLGCFPDGSFDYALSMFSTLGMIRTPERTRRALREAARILKPGGRLALHAHNVLLNLRDPPGPALAASGQIPRSLEAPRDVGDRRMTYRGMAGMEVHLYRWRELKREIAAAGLRIEEMLPLDDGPRPADRGPLVPALDPRRRMAALLRRSAILWE